MSFRDGTPPQPDHTWEQERKMTTPKSKTPERTLAVGMCRSSSLSWATKFMEDNKDILWESIAVLHSKFEDIERERDALLKAIYDAKLKLALNSSPEGISAAYEILRLASIEAKETKHE